MNDSTAYLERSTASNHIRVPGGKSPTAAASVPHGSRSQYSRTSTFASSTAFMRQLLQPVDHALRMSTPGMAFERARSGRHAKAGTKVGILCDRADSSGQRLHDAWFDEPSGFPVLEHLTDLTEIGRN